MRGQKRTEMKTTSLLTIVVVIVGSLFSPLCSTAKNIGVVGTLYDIVERDALKEMQEKAANLDINKIIKRNESISKIKNFIPSDISDLRKIEPAKKDSIFLVDMTYTLDMDIPDGKGNILYPRGYTFNPLDYITYPKTLVMLNANSPKQLVWFKQSEYAKDIKTSLLITDGPYYDLTKALKRPVFFASMQIVNVFRIKALPSIVRQKGNMMEVTEIDVSQVKPKPPPK
jgi:conjugal transfer pilus assembly protein TraW